MQSHLLSGRDPRYTEEAVYYLYLGDLVEEIPADVLLGLCSTLSSLIPEIDERSISSDVEYWTMWSAHDVYQRLTEEIDFNLFCSGSTIEETIVAGGMTVDLRSAINALNGLKETLKVRMHLFSLRQSYSHDGVRRYEIHLIYMIGENWTSSNCLECLKMTTTTTTRTAKSGGRVGHHLHPSHICPSFPRYL